MHDFFLHFFPLLTIFLFCLAGVYFFRYMNSLRRIERYMETNRPMDWEKLGKPSIFSGKYSDRNIRLTEFFDAESALEDRDLRMTLLWERSRALKKLLGRVTWSAFGMYLVSFFSVNFLGGNF